LRGSASWQAACSPMAPEESPLLASPAHHACEASVAPESPPIVARRLDFSDDLLRTPIQFTLRSPASQDPGTAASEGVSGHLEESPLRPPAWRHATSTAPDLPTVAVPAWQVSSVSGASHQLPPWPHRYHQASSRSQTHCTTSASPQKSANLELDIETEISRFLDGLGQSADPQEGQQWPVSSAGRGSQSSASPEEAHAVSSRRLLGQTPCVEDTGECLSKSQERQADSQSPDGTPSLSKSSASSPFASTVEAPKTLEEEVLPVKAPKTTEDEVVPVSQLSLVKCDHCGRSFRQDRLPVHESICRKTVSSDPRHVFESRRQRLGSLGERWWGVSTGSPDGVASVASASTTAASSTSSSPVKVASTPVRARAHSLGSLTKGISTPSTSSSRVSQDRSLPSAGGRSRGAQDLKSVPPLPGRGAKAAEGKAARSKACGVARRESASNKDAVPRSRSCSKVATTKAATPPEKVKPERSKAKATKSSLVQSFRSPVTPAGKSTSTPERLTKSAAAESSSRSSVTTATTPTKSDSRSAKRPTSEPPSSSRRKPIRFEDVTAVLRSSPGKSPELRCEDMQQTEETEQPELPHVFSSSATEDIAACFEENADAPVAKPEPPHIFSSKASGVVGVCLGENTAVPLAAESKHASLPSQLMLKDHGTQRCK